MPQFRIRDAADLLGVSDDTVRRWIDAGTLPASKDEVGRKVIDGVALAEFAQQHAASPAAGPVRGGAVRPEPVRRPGHQGDRRRRDGAGRGAVRPAHGGVADEQRGRPGDAARTRPAGRCRGQGDHGDHRNSRRYPRESPPLVPFPGSGRRSDRAVRGHPGGELQLRQQQHRVVHDQRGGVLVGSLLVRGGEFLGGAVRVRRPRVPPRPRPALPLPPRRPRRAR